MHGFCLRSSVITGFSLEAGIRASSTSMTTSWIAIDSAIERRALAM
jgi:hypothetical protein